MSNPNVRFCATAGCTDIAIGGNCATSNDHCRRHWFETVQADLVDVDVVGEYAIASADGRDVGKGGVARLHPGETDIVALVYGGAVKVRSAPAKAPKA